MALKIAVVGMRGIGNQHCQSHSKDPLAKLVAVCDVVKERADAAAQKYGVKAYYSLEDMLANEDLDIVDVTTGGYENGSWHFEPAMQALEAGKHVLVEKPISNNIDEARQMVAKAAEKKLYLGCNLNHYFTPAADRAKKYIADGEIGELVYCLHKMGFNGGEAGYAPATSSRMKGLPYFHLKAFLSHPFAVMRYFCGDITHVQAFVDRPGFRSSAGDLMLSIASIHVRFANGAVGYLLSQRGDATFGLGGWWSLEVAGTQGHLLHRELHREDHLLAGARLGEGQECGQRPGRELGADRDQFGHHRFRPDLPAAPARLPGGRHQRGPRREGARLRPRCAGRAGIRAAVIESYEQGGAMVRPHALPPLHGDPSAMLE